MIRSHIWSFGCRGIDVAIGGAEGLDPLSVPSELMGRRSTMKMRTCKHCSRETKVVLCRDCGNRACVHCGQLSPSGKKVRCVKCIDAKIEEDARRAEGRWPN